MQLTARIRAICIVFALLMVPGMVQATDYYLVGDFNKWTASDTYKFNVSGTTATLSLTGAQINDASTQFLIKAVESSSKSWFLKNSSTSVTSVTVGGDAVTASSYYNETGGNYSVSGLSTASTTTYTFTLTADGTDINSSKLKITSATTGVGGGTTTTVNQPGIYLYGQNFGATDPNKHLTYKFLRKNDSEYHFALYAGSMKFSVEKYEQDRGKLDITPSWNNWQFKIATSMLMAMSPLSARQATIPLPILTAPHPRLKSLAIILNGLFRTMVVCMTSLSRWTQMGNPHLGIMRVTQTALYLIRQALPVIGLQRDSSIA